MNPFIGPKIVLPNGHQLTRQLSSLCWYGMLFLSIMVTMVVPHFLPDRFFFDASNIASYFVPMAGSFVPHSSYISTAYLYNILHLHDRYFTIPFIQSLMYAALVAYVLKKTAGSRVNLPKVALAVALIVIQAPFYAWYTKEFVVLFLVALFLWAVKKRWRLFIWTASCLVYTYYFRTYWAIIIAIFWMLYASRAVGIRPLGIICTGLLSLFVLAVLFQFVLGMNLVMMRSSINASRVANQVIHMKSAIAGIMPATGLLSSWINAVYVWVILILPIPLLIMFTPYYMASFAFISSVTMQVGKKFLLLQHVGVNRKVTVMILWLIAITLTQSIFEPDYGSFIRHLSPFFPLILYVMFEEKYLLNKFAKRKISNEQFVSNV